jgi:type VI secretion system secreted protein Hcp
MLALVLAALLLAAIAVQAAGPHPGPAKARAAGGILMTMKVTGSKQGVFKGDDVTLDRRGVGLIVLSGYQFELVSPRDAASGQATGKRQYKPLTITHELGGSSPQFLAAASTNENLSSVVINFYRSDPSGKDVNYYRVTLTNASISDVRQYTGNSSVLEDVSFTFQKVEQSDLVAKTTFIDNFQTTT